MVMCAWERWQNGESLGYLLLMAVAIMGTWVVVRLAVLWVIRSFVRQVVLQTGSLCRGCGYDLTGNVSGVCPECGLAGLCEDRSSRTSALGGASAVLRCGREVDSLHRDD
ncbi:MAG TPA: hypothetical protein PK184_09890 [Phycisphaerae bacterium]|nr:hypothetical protein [Phycisphaerae bacterium]HOJ54604.1 hypothetical protein [Phycisphaerae bacterium]HOL28215.1 hypothetical protein [Phycisphaerae bacterium]HPP21030.1 hypothetical protein [Phycisphaerae bacterium]HPU32992.1 hypothetical protein [Phycisphaerae bacterium]